MKNTAIYNDFLGVIAIWEKGLEQYTPEELGQKPDPGSWSMGQVYNHLVRSTLGFHLNQVNTCLASEENRKKGKNFKGFLTYNVMKSFPPIKIKVPPSETYTPKQPSGKKELEEGLVLMKQRMKETMDLLQTNRKSGKSLHPAFGYLNADEWFQLVAMHLKHHLRQKARLDGFLGKRI